MQNERGNFKANLTRFFLTSILVFACTAAFADYAQTQNGAPPIPAPMRTPPDQIKDPPGGPREDVWKDKDGRETRVDSYGPLGQRLSIRIIRRCPDGSVDETEIFHFEVLAGGVVGLKKWEKWVFGCGRGNAKPKSGEIWDAEVHTEDADIPAKRTVIVREHTEEGRVVRASETVYEWDPKTETWVRKTDRVGALPTPGRSSAANGFAVTNDVGGGLNTTTFSTPRGKIRVYLPDDIAAGDTISGTVSAEPEGRNESETARNQDELKGYVVELEKQQTSTTDRVLKTSLPAATSSVTHLILKDAKGKEVSRNELPVSSSTPPSREFDLPIIGQAGRPVEVRGSFDGDLGTTKLQSGGQNLELLAESPRKVVARTTSKPLGVSELDVREGNQTARGEFRTVAIALSAGKLDLLKGEQTTLVVKVSGLEDLKESVPLELANKSSSVIQMDGGDLQRMNISPSQVQAGTYTTERSLTGIQRGAFTITGTIISPRRKLTGSTGDARAKEVNQPGFPWSTVEAVATRCRITQRKRLENCKTDQCRQQVLATLKSCDQLVDDTSLSCSGIKPLQQCTVGSPCNLGKDMDGDGVNDSCVTGARCAPASEGRVCDPGVLYDCVLVTVYYAKGPFRPLAECDCECK